MHRLGSFFQFQVTPFLVYAFVSLQMAAYFGNYSTVVEKLHLLVNNMLGSTEAGVGNLIAEGNAGKIRKVFSELFSLRMLIAGTVCFPFTSFWSHSSRFGWGRNISFPGKSCCCSLSGCSSPLRGGLWISFYTVTVCSGMYGLLLRKA